MDPITIAIITTIPTAIVTSFLTYYFGFKKESKIKLLEYKQKGYRDILEYSLAFFDGWVDIDKQKKFAEELYTRAPLYASDTVIKSGRDFLECFNTDKELRSKSDEYYYTMIIAIRNDLKKIIGEKTKLKNSELKILKFKN